MISHQPLTSGHLFVFCDGGARGNPGPAAIGFMIKDSQGKILVQKGEYIGKTTNNVAEYTAVIKALEWLKQQSHSVTQSLSHSVTFYLDSKLVVNQLNGLFKIKNRRLQNLVITIKKLERELSLPLIYRHISREKNYLADRLVNKALNNI
jgi:ribonuclease HI